MGEGRSPAQSSVLSYIAQARANNKAEVEVRQRPVHGTTTCPALRTISEPAICRARWPTGHKTVRRFWSGRDRDGARGAISATASTPSGQNGDAAVAIGCWPRSHARGTHRSGTSAERCPGRHSPRWAPCSSSRTYRTEPASVVVVTRPVAMSYTWPETLTLGESNREPRSRSTSSRTVV